MLGDGTELDLVVGEIYHDFSGHEKKAWLNFDHVGQDPTRFGERINIIVSSKKTSNDFGLSLLYLGYKRGRDFERLYTEVPTKLYFYFLAEEQIVGAETSFHSRIFDKFIQLWPKDEKLIHRNIY